jgi:hypothetical protein
VIGNADKVAEALKDINNNDSNIADVFEYLKNSMSELAEYSNRFTNILKELYVESILMATAGLIALIEDFYLLKEKCNK